MSKNKNVSKKIKNGTRIQTRDEFIKSDNKNDNPYKINHPNINDLYRGGHVVDSNLLNNIVISVETTKNKTKPKGNHSEIVNIKFRNEDLLEIDGKKVVRGKEKKDLSKKEVNSLKKILYRKSKYAITNRNKSRHIKGRPPLKQKKKSK